MHITAAVVDAPGAPFAVRPLTLESPRPDEVLVRIVGTGVCHTDVICRDGWIPVPTPIVLGHEGSGVVEAVGDAVTELEVGDHVVLGWGRGCGRCGNCLRGDQAYCDDMGRVSFGGTRLADGSTSLSHEDAAVHSHFIGQSSFASHALVSAAHAVRVDRDLPLELLGPLGCGVLTGAGAVWDALGVAAGDTIAIVGAGAVGLSSVMAAAASGASVIVAVDRNAERLELALELGATHVIGPDADVAGGLAAIAPAGFDWTLETTADPDLLRVALEATRLRGTCGLVGAAPAGTELRLDAFSVLLGRTLRGIIVGDCVPAVGIPRMLALYRAGRFPFDRLIRTYPFAEINQAVEDSLAGRTVKPVLTLP